MKIVIADTGALISLGHVESIGLIKEIKFWSNYFSVNLLKSDKGINKILI